MAQRGGVVHGEAIDHTCACGHVIAISMVAGRAIGAATAATAMALPVLRGSGIY